MKENPIKFYREKAGLTQAEVARGLGYTTAQYISNVERGRCVLSVKAFPAFQYLTKMPEKKFIAYIQEATAKKIRKVLK